jgi:hypothetical protein
MSPLPHGPQRIHGRLAAFLPIWTAIAGNRMREHDLVCRSCRRPLRTPSAQSPSEWVPSRRGRCSWSTIASNFEFFSNLMMSVVAIQVFCRHPCLCPCCCYTIYRPTTLYHPPRLFPLVSLFPPSRIKRLPTKPNVDFCSASFLSNDIQVFNTSFHNINP